MYASFVAAVLATAGRPPGEREGPWYDEHVKVHEYAGMAATAREIRAHGCPVLLSGPFTGQIHDGQRWRSWVAELGGGTVRLVWVRSDEATLLRRLTARGLGRDAAKLAEFERFCASMRLGTEPAAPHVTVDNRLTATVPLADQVAALVRGSVNQARYARGGRLPGSHLPHWPPGVSPVPDLRAVQSRVRRGAGPASRRRPPRRHIILMRH